MMISKFITDPYNLASLLFILAIFVGKATQTQGGVPFPKALFLYNLMLKIR